MRCSPPDSFAHLGGLEQTAWLTAWSHCRGGDLWRLERPVSRWLIDTVGEPPFVAELKYFTWAGIALRAALIDQWVLSILQAREEPVELWSLACGFDSRWQLLAAAKLRPARYVELDRPDLLAAKAASLASSPFAHDYAGVERLACDLRQPLPDALRSQRPVLIILEGLLDYLTLTERLRLLEQLAEAAPRRLLILDAQNAWLQRLNNRHPQAATGAAAVRFANSAADPAAFYQHGTGLRLQRSAWLIPRLLAARCAPLRHLPLPQTLKQGYGLLQLAGASW